MKLGLGGAQFGLDYGVSNRQGQTGADELRKILSRARESGLQLVDTAALYGDSEASLGQAGLGGFKVITKTPKFATSPETVERVLDESLFSSLKKMGLPQVEGLLVHEANDLMAPWGERIYARLLAHRQRGSVLKIGVSVYDANQIDEILRRFEIDLIQLPLNILDQRLIRSGHLKKLKARGVEIHARSAFLQGALVMDPDLLPRHFESVRNHLKKYHDFLPTQNLTPIEAALGFVAAQPEVDQVICGVNNAAQLQELIQAEESARGKLDLPKLSGFAWSEIEILNPALWKKESA